MKLNKIISAFSAILIAAGSISLSRSLTYAESDNYTLTSSVYADETESNPITTTTTAKSTTSTKASCYYFNNNFCRKYDLNDCRHY